MAARVCILVGGLMLVLGVVLIFLLNAGILQGYLCDQCERRLRLRTRAKVENQPKRTALCHKCKNNFAARLAQCPKTVQDRYAALDAFLKALGNDVQVSNRGIYVAYKRNQTVARVLIRPQHPRILVYVKFSPEIELVPGFTRDVRGITGGLEITIDSDDDLERAKPLLTKCYEAS